jgi:N-acetylglucosaminyldiphosphoundecaprenol N-acetyl-beta-D-mannosaminyltransferase
VGTNDISTLAASKIKEKYPNVNIIGSSSQFTFKKKDDDKTIKYIRKCMSESNINSLDILLVCYKQVEQEKWINRNSKKIPALVSIGVGRTFEYISGLIKKPHNITYKYNISWIYSLINEPWRLNRIINAFPLFPLRIYMESIEKKK